MADHSIQSELGRYRQGTFADVIYRNALLYPEKEAFVQGTARVSFSEYNLRVNRLIHALRSLGLTKGDVIGVLSWNSLEVADAFGAAMKGGFLVAPFNARLQASEIERTVNDSRTSVLLVGPECAEAVDGLRGRLPFVKHYVSAGVGLPGMLSYDPWTSSHSTAEPEASIQEDDPFLIIYTSGTTGDPKGALYTHRSQMAHAMLRIWQLEAKARDRNFLVVPMFHISGTVVWAYFLVGATTIISPMRSFNAAETLRWIQEERATFLHIVPTQLVAILALPNLEEYDLSTLKGILYAASPMPVELLRRGLAAFGPVFMQGYGQSESGPDITFLHKAEHDVLDAPPEQQKVLGSAGRPCIGVHVRIVDDAGHDLPQGQMGEILVQSRFLMEGYWLKPEETGRTIVDGWLRTGDMGCSDHRGYVYIVDRKKDMIVSGGENVYPREVEEVLYRHPSVREAAVIGLPDPYWIERVHAVVVPSGRTPASAEELRSFCRRHLADYKVPKSIDIVEHLPKNATGKILKKELRSSYGAPDPPAPANPRTKP